MPKKPRTYQQHRRAAEDKAIAILNAETPKETAAHPENYRQFHTGPKTPMGKVKSSKNALRHGLCSVMLLLPDENPEEHQILSRELMDEHKPATMTERILVQEMIEHHWRLIRSRNREGEALHSGCDIDDPTLRLCHRYATSHERSFHRALKTLRQLQKERLDKMAAEIVSKKSEPAPAQPQTAAAPAEFVSQNTAAASSALATVTSARRSKSKNAASPGIAVPEGTTSTVKQPTNGPATKEAARKS